MLQSETRKYGYPEHEEPGSKRIVVRHARRGGPKGTYFRIYEIVTIKNKFLKFCNS
jgi:hypothetical protein